MSGIWLILFVNFARLLPRSLSHTSVGVAVKEFLEVRLTFKLGDFEWTIPFYSVSGHNPIRWRAEENKVSASQLSLVLSFNISDLLIYYKPLTQESRWLCFSGSYTRYAA